MFTCNAHVHLLVIAVLFLAGPSYAGPSDGSWNYGWAGPSFWHRTHPVCMGRFQSPIDVRSDEATRVTKWSPLRLSSLSSIKMMLSNKGLALHAGMTGDCTVQLTGGPLGERVYRVAQFHIHHAVDGPRGSEHTIDGVQTEAEIHIVTFNTKYGTLGNAVDKHEGLAVIGAMIESADETHSRDLLAVLNEFSYLNFKGDKSPIKLSLQNLLPHDFSTNFYTYKGSLTTPPCSETVTWLLARRTIKVHDSLLKGLSYVYTGNNETDTGPLMSGNFRPVQPLLGRKVMFMDRATETKTETETKTKRHFHMQALSEKKSSAGLVSIFTVLQLTILSLLAAFRLF